MNNQIGLGIFGTFGEPHGFQQVFYYGAQFRTSLDLNDNAIEFYPGTSLYSISREIVDGVHSICISIYSYAQELNTTRMGTFLGSCMVLQDGFTEAEYIYKVLNSLHQDLMSNEENIEDNVIKVAQGADIIIREPAEFVAAQANLIPLNRTPFFSAFVDEGKKLLVVPSPHAFGNTEKEVIDFIDEALKHYSDTGTLYFSFDKNVYSFVASAGVIPVLEWEEFIDRKAQMQQSTAVRTKKGIQKITPDPVADTTETEVSDDEYKAWLAEEEIKEKESKDPYKPFLIWEEPEELWSHEEQKERVGEYNRLFRYTNTLIDHINEPQYEQDTQGRKKRVLVAALLLLLIGGSVAVYYYGIYDPAAGLAKIAAAPETPRTIQQSNIITDSVAAVTGIDSTISAEMAASPENKTTRRQVADVSYNDIAADLDKLEAKFEDKQDVVVPPVTPQAVNNKQPLSKELVSNNGRPQQAPASVHTHTPVATTSIAAAEPPAETGGMPQINMPASPRANLPSSAVYNDKPRPDPAWLNSVTRDPVAANTTKSALPSKPVAPEAVAKQGNSITPANTNTPVAATQNKTTLTAAARPGTEPSVPAQNATQPVAGKQAPATVQTVAATKVVPTTTLPATATSVAPTALGKAGTIAAPPAATPTLPKANTGAANPANAPATAAALTATSVNSVTPAKQVSLNAAPTAGTAKATGVPSAIATQPLPAKRDSNKPAVAGTSAGTSSSTITVGRAPLISSGVSAGEMSRANAVALPQLKTSPDIDQIKLKTLYPRPNGTITQRDIPVLSQMGIKNKTLTQLTRLIIENAPEDVGKYYKGQELQYAAALLNNNRQAFQRIGDDYVCTADYLILHVPAIIKPKRPASFPK